MMIHYDRRCPNRGRDVPLVDVYGSILQNLLALPGFGGSI
jgi:hypothetical protein